MQENKKLGPMTHSMIINAVADNHNDYTDENTAYSVLKKLQNNF